MKLTTFTMPMSSGKSALGMTMPMGSGKSALGMTMAMKALKQGKSVVVFCNEASIVMEHDHVVDPYPAHLSPPQCLGEGIARVCKRVKKSRGEEAVGLAVACELLNGLGVSATLYQAMLESDQMLPGQRHGQRYARATRKETQVHYLVHTEHGWFDSTGQRFSALDHAWPSGRRRGRAAAVKQAQLDLWVELFTSGGVWPIANTGLMNQLTDEMRLAVLKACTPEVDAATQRRRL